MGFRHDDYTIAWVCALPLEMAAAMTMLDEVHQSLPQPATDYNAYRLGNIIGHNVVVACLPSGVYGTTSAATVIAHMCGTFPSLQFALMVGIGGGVPSKNADIRLGDVVVSMPTAGSGGLVQYDYGKTLQGGSFQRTGSLNKPPQSLLTAVSRIRSDHIIGKSLIGKNISESRQKHQTTSEHFSRPDQDRLFKAAYSHESKVDDCSLCDQSQLVSRPPRETDEPYIHYGLIASGNQVMKDAKTRDFIAQQFDVLCFDMEAAGLMDMIPCLVIRGICDYCDSHKNKQWQGYAALTSAAYTKALLHIIPVPGPPSQPSVTSPNLSPESKDLSLVANWIFTENTNISHYELLNQSHQGTGRWVLDSEEYRKWVSGENRTMFCEAAPGAGKSTLSAILVEELRSIHSNTTSVGVAAVYCSYKRRDEQNSSYFLSSILKQLIQDLRHLPEAISSLYQDHITRGTRPSYDDLSNGLQSLIEPSRQYFIIIDALDECSRANGMLKSVLSELFRLQNYGQVFLCATSRPIPDIAKHFDGAVHFDAQAAENDLRSYVDSYMPRFPPHLENDLLLQDKIKTELTKAANGMFLFVKIHMEVIISRPTRKHILAVLDSLATKAESFEPFCIETMDRIMDQMSESKSLAIHSLSWMTYSRVQLSISDLRHALAIEIGSSSFDKDKIRDIEEIVSACCGLLNYDEAKQTVFFSHPVIHKCLRKMQKTWLSAAERHLADSCITYLCYEAFRSGPCTSHEDFDLRLRSFPLFQYAANHWAHHVSACGSGDESLLMTFLCDEGASASAFQVLLASRPGFDSSKHITYQTSGLHLAAYSGLDRVIPHLLQRGQSPFSLDTYGNTPLLWAARQGHTRAIRELSTCDETTLSIVIQRRDLNLVDQLIEAGYNVNVKGFWNRSPLHQAILAKDAVLTQKLLAAQADTNSKDSDDSTPLQLAVRCNDLQFVELLLRNSATEKGIMLSDWRKAFKQDSSTVVRLSEGTHSGKLINFVGDDCVCWPTHNHDSQRTLRTLW
ncbi:hypothetical protein BJX63DRAFT_77013 [Aspergillus granulosus]|uniref:Nucleoside phosphorylase domain-containing protein n=1 Tax=Aspergillus granulosus TaxID=176169 RepID=A0ABR4GW62_9EURO